MRQVKYNRSADPRQDLRNDDRAFQKKLAGEHVGEQTSGTVESAKTGPLWKRCAAINAA